MTRRAAGEGADGAAGEPGMAGQREDQLGEAVAVAHDGGVGARVAGERGGVSGSGRRRPAAVSAAASASPAASPWRRAAPMPSPVMAST